MHPGLRTDQVHGVVWWWNVSNIEQLFTEQPDAGQEDGEDREKGGDGVAAHFASHGEGNHDQGQNAENGWARGEECENSASIEIS